ncbi:NAD(P)-binding protein [Daldinia sp. FL1419]|nr:NAD(P)-binding protein [Daldinia sp. FL1419]
MSVRQKSALITGCGCGGIGEALAHEYTRAGIRAIATILPTESGEHLTEAGITWFYLDVTIEESIIKLKRQVSDLTGDVLDVLVNNAGICYTMTAIDTDITAVQKMFDVNIFGPIRMVHHFHPLIISSSGVIVNIGSVGGICPYIYGASYNATKAALHHWSNTLRVEMAPLRVKVLTTHTSHFLLLNSDNTLKESQVNTHPISRKFKKLIRGICEVTTNRFVYANHVVVQSLKLKPPAWFWYGKTSGIVRFLDTFAPRTIWDHIMSRMFNLGKLKRHFDMKKKR